MAAWTESAEGVTTVPALFFISKKGRLPRSVLENST
jgi:hypothetical protein